MSEELKKLMELALHGYSNSTISYDYVKMLELFMDDREEYDRRYAEYAQWAEEYLLEIS